MYEFGKIVLVPFPFTDLSAQKLRPALIVSKSSKSHEDVVVLFITSRSSPNQKHVYPLSIRDKGLAGTGLKVDSFLRCDKIATLNKQIILGEIGELAPLPLKQVGKLFREVFGF